VRLVLGKQGKAGFGTLLRLHLCGMDADCLVIGDAGGGAVVEVGQVEGVVGEGLPVELNQVGIILLCQLPNNTAGNLHLPKTKQPLIPYLLAGAYLSAQ